jgi:DNA excision repair protein ERCC-2
VDLFPYAAFRPFQKEVYEAVYNGLREGKTVLINAPTGLGKTAAVLTAAVRYLLETDTPIHYVVRTRTELEPPVRELSKILARGVYLDYVVIKSRQDMCCYPQLKKLNYPEFLAECNLLKRMGRCVYYPPKEVEAPLKSVSTYVKYLCASQSCPYEYAKRKMKDAKLVISTYYYIFGRERADIRGRVVIVDEAHSLFDAVVHIHNIALSEADLRAAYREAKKYGFLEEAGKLYRLLTFIKRSSGPVDIGDVLGLVSDVDLDTAIWEITKRKTEERVNPYTPLLLVKELREALRERLRYYGEVKDESSTKTLVLYPLDPATLIRESLRGAKSVVYISGTLPISLFAESLGVSDYVKLDISFSDFIPRQNYVSIVDVGVTTKFEERNEEMYLRIAQRLATAINLSPGGVLAMFPSYDVMRGVRKYLKISIPHWYEGSQEVEWDTAEKFFIGAVARGRYVEGVEYVRDGKNLLTFVVVVGVPYPEPSPYLDRRVEMLKPRLREKAWNAVYLYHAVVSVRQAVGRLFRSPQDRGVVAFLDRRYAEPELWNELRDILTSSVIVNHLEEAERLITEFFTSATTVSR